MSVLRVRDGATLRGDYTLRGETAAAPPPPPPAEPLVYPEFWVKYSSTVAGWRGFGGGVLPAAMEDITEDVISVEWARGGGGVLEDVPAGSATIRLKNPARQWEPGFAAGPHHPIEIGEIFAIGCTWLGGDYTLFYGFSESIDVVWDPNWVDVWSEVEIRLVDAMALLPYSDSAYSAPLQEAASVRIGKVLDFSRILFPTTMRNISGGPTCINHVGQLGHGLEYIQTVAKTGLGRPFWIDRRGFATYTGTTSSGLTFGDDLDAGELKYTASRLHVGKEQLITSAAVTILGGGTPTVVSVPVGWAYKGQSHSRTTLNRNGVEALALAQAIVDAYSTPIPRLEGFRVMPGGSEELWTAVITLDLQHTLTVRRRPPGGGTMYTQTEKVVGLKWSLPKGSPMSTVIEYTLST